MLNPKPLAEGYPGYLALYLAAQVPAVRAGHDVDLATVAPQRAWIEALGFRVTCDSAGLRAHATERVARRFANRVDGGQVLAHVATTLHGMAWALSAEVVQLPPE